MTAPRPKHARRAFSLFETLIALGLIVVLSASVFTFIFELLDRRERLIDATLATGSRAAIFDRLERDLAAAVVATGQRAGVVGASESISVVSRGVVAPRSPDDTGSPGDLVSAELRFESDTGRLLARSAPVLRSSSEPEFVPIADGLRSVRFRFHDGRAWRDSFNSRSAGRLPMLVELSLWAGRPDDPEDPEELDPLADASPDADAPEDLFNTGPRSAQLSADDLLEPEDLGPPTRRRVFIVPDAGPDTPSGGTS